MKVLPVGNPTAVRRLATADRSRLRRSDLVWETAAEHLAPLLRVVGQELDAQDI